jgi:hypothetical protein
MWHYWRSSRLFPSASQGWINQTLEWGGPPMTTPSTILSGFWGWTSRRNFEHQNVIVPTFPAILWRKAAKQIYLRKNRQIYLSARTLRFSILPHGRKVLTSPTSGQCTAPRRKVFCRLVIHLFVCFSWVPTLPCPCLEWNSGADGLLRQRCTLTIDILLFNLNITTFRPVAGSPSPLWLRTLASLRTHTPSPTIRVHSLLPHLCSLGHSFIHFLKQRLLQ